VWGILVLGAIVFLPAIRTPFFLDDYLHIAMVEGTFPVRRNPLDLYNFVDDGARPTLVSHGFLPWWAHPQLTIRFLRPLSSALLFVDHNVFRGHPLPMHLHSLAWWALAVLAVRALYLRAFSPRVSLIATAIFALAPCHTMPLAWLANREAIVSLAFGALALGAHDAWRKAERRRDALLSALLFTLAFLGGGEYAIAFGGYVLALELLDKRSLAKRALGAAPFALPGIVYLAVRAWLDYGAVGSGFYSDPIKAPLSFVTAMPWRFVALVAKGWLSVDAHSYLPSSPRWLLALGIALLVAIAAVPMRRALTGLEGAPRRAATWLAAGSVFSLAPVLAVVPNARILGVATIGVASAIAILLEHAWFPSTRPPRRGLAELTQLVALGLGFAHLIHGPVSACLEARHLRHDADGFATRAKWLHERVDTTTNVGIVRGLAMTMFMPFAIDPDARPPRAWRLLAHCGHVLVLRRDERTIELVVPRGRSIIPEAELSLYRSSDIPFRPGDVVNAPGMTVTIVDADEHGPTRARFDFDEDPALSYVWFSEDFDAWHTADLPQAGFGAPFDP
jgi:hypothetical protein